MYTTTDVTEIKIDVTTYCNARCPQCHRFDDKNVLVHELMHMPYQDIIENVNTDIFPNLKYLWFEGDLGDIINHPQALELAQAYQNIKRVYFPTNGSLRSESFWKELAKVKNLTVQFAIDGLEDTNHLYRQNTDFNKILKNATTYINAGGTAVWQFIIFKHNEHQIQTAEKLAKELGFEKFKLIYSARSWHNGLSTPVYNNGVRQSHDLEASTLAQQYNGTDSSELMSLFKNRKEKISNISKIEFPIKCQGYDNGHLFITREGNVIPCCMLSGDFYQNNTNTKFFRALVKDMKSINFYHTPMRKIFESEFYKTNLPKSLQKRAMPTCIIECGLYKK